MQGPKMVVYDGFVMGLSLGIVVGYFWYIFRSTNVKDPRITQTVDQEPKPLRQMLSKIPSWIENPDFLQAEWLNNAIRLMWPFLDEAITKMANEVAKYLTIKYIGSVEIETLSLGTVPPTFQDVKVRFSEEKELIIEPVLKWDANPNIIVTAKTYGFKATVKVTDFQVSGRPRITLKPLDYSYPPFRNVYVSLMGKVLDMRNWFLRTFVPSFFM